MTPHAAVPPPRPSVLKRFGPLTVLLAGVLVAAALASTGESATGPVAKRSSIGSAKTRIPISLAQAENDGTVDDFQWDSKTCDRKTGRVKVPSVYAPPCLANRPGVKGGATYRGVSSKSIKVVIYQAAPDDIAAALQANLDSAEDSLQTQKDLIRMLESRFQMWGRKIEIIRMQGRGVDEDNARADAVKVATEIKAFASIGGPLQQDAYAKELAARGVLCISCGLTLPDAKYQELSPYVWGVSQSPEQFLLSLADLVIGQLNKKKAIYAGDPAMHDRERVFGAVNFEQDPPVFDGTAKMIEERGKKFDFKVTKRITYQLVIPELAQKARSIISQLKAAKVTTVFFLGDPIMPISLTQAATDQDYYPEWVITGTVLTDTTTFGRQFDQKQWANAFGISTIPVMVPQEQSEAWRLHKWFYGKDPVAQKTVGINFAPIQMFMLGVHMAGPHLTPETFRDGLFAYPPSGGSATAPQISWGDHGVYPEPDYLGIDDMQLIWWDPTAKGADEQGAEGTGHMRSANGGERYLPGKMGTDPGWVQRKEGSVVSFPEPVDDLPDYPSPSGGD